MDSRLEFLAPALLILAAFSKKEKISLEKRENKRLFRSTRGETPFGYRTPKLATPKVKSLVMVPRRAPKKSSDPMEKRKNTRKMVFIDNNVTLGPLES